MLFENIANNVISFYSYVKSNLRSKDKIVPLKNDKGEILIMNNEVGFAVVECGG